MSPRNYCGVPPPPHTSQCKLEQQACLAGKQLTARCEGQCPCPAPADSKQGEHFGGDCGFGEGVPLPEHHSTPLKSPPHPHLVPAELCTGQDLADLGERLRDWFQLLRENAKHNGSSSGPPGTGASRRCTTPSPAPPKSPQGRVSHGAASSPPQRWRPAARRRWGGCLGGWTPAGTGTWSSPSWRPSTWTSTRRACAPSSTPATPPGTAASPPPSGASASGGKVRVGDVLRGLGGARRGVWGETPS